MSKRMDLSMAAKAVAVQASPATPSMITGLVMRAARPCSNGEHQHPVADKLGSRRVLATLLRTQSAGAAMCGTRTTDTGRKVGLSMVLLQQRSALRLLATE